MVQFIEEGCTTRGGLSGRAFTWCCFLTIVLISVTPALSQDSTEVRSRINRVQGRLSDGTGLELQYSRFVGHVISGDILFQTSAPGPSLGVTVYPMGWLWGQARIGLPLYKGLAAPDGPPPFSPDVMVALRGGVDVFLPRSRVFLEFAAGRILVIQQKYCSTCGGFVPDGAPIPVQVFIRRQESLDLLSIGIGMSF